MSSPPPPPSEERERLERELSALGAAMPSELDDVAVMFDSLQDRLAEEESSLTGWLRARPHGVRLALSFLVVAAPVGLSWFTARPLASDHPVERMTAFVLFALSLLALCLLTGLRPQHMPAWSARRVVGLVLACLAGLAVLNGFPAPAAAMAAQTGVPTGCIGIGLAAGVAVYLLLRVMDRGDNPHLAALALAAGLSANLTLHLHCASVHPAHNLTGHFGVVLLLLSLYALFERRRLARAR